MSPAWRMITKAGPWPKQAKHNLQSEANASSMSFKRLWVLASISWIVVGALKWCCFIGIFCLMTHNTGSFGSSFLDEKWLSFIIGDHTGRPE